MGTRPHTQSFKAEPASIAAARKFAADLVVPVHPDLSDAVSLMVSELATNAVLHGQSTYVVGVETLTTSVHVEVSDMGPGVPVRTEALPTVGRGRGLAIVDVIADSWGVVQGESPGKTVWFELRSQGSAAGTMR